MGEKPVFFRAKNLSVNTGGGLVTHGTFDARNCDAGILTFGILTHGDERRSDTIGDL
jgi:hypothetical protein